MCRFSSSLNDLHLALEEFGFRDTILSKDSNDIKEQGENEPSGIWVSRASLGFLGLASSAVGDVDADRAADAMDFFLTLSPTPVTLANSLSWTQCFPISKEKIMKHHWGAEAYLLFAKGLDILG